MNNFIYLNYIFIKNFSKPEELLSVKPVIIGATSGIVKRDGTIAVRLSSEERFLWGVRWVL